MKNKLWLLGILSVLLISMFAYLVMGLSLSGGFNEGGNASIINNITLTGRAGPDIFLIPGGYLTGSLASSYRNLSGILYNITINLNFNATHNHGISNVTVTWQLNVNETFVLNQTLAFGPATNWSDTTSNNCGVTGGNCLDIGWFNFTIDTNSLPDGRYNITFTFRNLTNSTHGSNADSSQFIRNDSVAWNITVDNTKPTVGPFGFNSTFSDAWGGNTLITFSNSPIGYFGTDTTVFEKNITINLTLITDALSGVNWTVLMFNNATGNDFNVTVPNATTYGEGNRPTNNNNSFYGVNMTSLFGGMHTVTLLAYDYAGNVNNSRSINFIVNTAPNVTINSNSTVYGGSYNLPNLHRGNFSKSGINSILNFSGLAQVNFSVGNMTVSKIYSSGGSLGHVNVTLSFDNATTDDTTTAFNISSVTNGAGADNTRTSLNTSSPSESQVVYYNYTINVSTLKEGRHIARILANDSRGNFNYSVFYNFTVDFTAPAITVNCDTSNTPGQTVTCTCSASDSLTGVKVAAKFQGDTDASESTTASSVGSFTTSNCVATDYADNIGSGSGTYTIVAASSTGGGGSGGSGGGSSTGSTGTFESKTWTSIYEGETATVEIDEGLGVTKVEFKVNDDVYGATVRVTKRDSFPSTVSDPEGKVYRKLEIYAGPSLKEGVVGDRNVYFKVEKSWLTENSVDKSEVVLLRYVDNKWTSLPTTVEGDEADSVSYKAVTPGFSYFVIGTMAGAAAVEEAPAGEGVTGAPTGEAEVAEETGGVGSTAFVVVLVLVVVLAVIFFIYKKRKM